MVIHRNKKSKTLSKSKPCQKLSLNQHDNTMNIESLVGRNYISLLQGKRYEHFIISIRKSILGSGKLASILVLVPLHFQCTYQVFVADKNSCKIE